MIEKDKLTGMQLLGISEAKQACGKCGISASNVWIKQGKEPYITHTFHCCEYVMGWNPKAGWQIVTTESSGPIPDVFLSKKKGLA
jgi:hypothetical protein